ncbi:ABC transporter substrate-binding protein [Halomonas pacifica]|uniref:ABC transporter substrate-binding protein n=1 Tax=Bisbaumannia pacifica TaxID=77098 RepID=A0A510X964_9GAMM|nr:ABC transporter substrate-binding protein [Halomonas pacifica]MBH8579914.1 carbohydrate ABC transporter substrate-binding protein [Halomonas pacifica]MDC8803516.1 ABC transporter substrate-binding protein [Halomonas pacifica]GEK47982.1 ABC transporter substrate-binding protein [Halomonas pacifica]
MKNKRLGLAIVASGLLIASGGAHAIDEQRRAVIERWVDEVFQDSTLTREQQIAELEWFARAAEPFRGMSINTVAEGLTTHAYERDVLAQAFSEITGIEVTHNIIGEGDVVDNMQTQMQSGRNIYDAYVNDSDAIGTHIRYGTTINLSEAMANEWADFTLPSLDLDDFIGIQYTTGPDGSLYQLPTQQFANLYWFRYDWFQREDLRAQFRERYGYELGVPTNWTAYEDIAEFFSEHVEEIDGVRVYGHMDYGRRDPSLGWRFHDSWLSMAGMGSPGVPFGNPVDDWGIRVDEQSRPVGASVSRGGATNSPASVFAVTKMVDWLRDYAPPEAQGMTFGEAGPVPAQGNIAQQMFWYTAFTADMTDPSLPVTDDEGNPLWRMAPSPVGPYWEEGMKVGYQDVGSWTFFDSTPEDRRTAAWLFAQFTVSKTVSLEKLLDGLTPIRRSDIFSETLTEMAPRLGGLVEFYRSANESNWTPTGTNVPDYPRMAPLWWQNLAPAVSGEVTPQQALDNLAADLDNLMGRLARANVFETYAPLLNDERAPEFWLDEPGAPKPRLEDERPPGQTMPYDQMMEEWMAAGSRY